MFNPKFDAAYFNSLQKGHFPSVLGISIIESSERKMIAEMPVRADLFAPNGFIHAGSIVTLADTVAGFAAIAHLPKGAKSFTTMELKSNFLGAIREGTLECTGIPEHLGRSSQVWRAEVRNKETQKKIAIFSCTQLILY